MPKSIDWKRVSANLYCPKCGDKAYISAESDGSQGEHTHKFPISRQWAMELSAPSETEKAELRRKTIETLEDVGIDRATRDRLVKLS